MRILLINPPRRHELVGKNPSIIEKHRGFNPPLGLLYLAAMAKRSSSHAVDVIDTQPLRWDYETLKKHLQGTAYDLVGVTGLTFTLVDVFKTIQVIKEASPGTKVLVGGTHVHLFPEETINLPGVDYAFMGEAEHSLTEFVDAYAARGSFASIPGLVYKGRDGTIVKNPIRLQTDLDTIPFPERDRLGIQSYNSLLSRGSLSTTIISSRGCPFHCAFCDRPLSPITSRFRVRSAGNVVDELSACVDLGIREFLFYDDTFTVKRSRVMEICDEILARGLKIRWDIRTRVDVIDSEMLKALKKAGCVAIHYGVEAGNDRVLKEIKKGFSIATVKEAFRLTRRAGIDTLAYFMIGLPTERIEDIRDSFRLARELKPAYAHFTIFSPYPGTELYQRGRETGVIPSDVWREFARSPTEGFRLPLWEEHFTREELYDLIVKFYKNFYMRPGYFLARAVRVRSLNELRKKASAAFSVFRMKKNEVDKVQ